MKWSSRTPSEYSIHALRLNLIGSALNLCVSSNVTDFAYAHPDKINVVLEDFPTFISWKEYDGEVILPDILIELYMISLMNAAANSELAFVPVYHACSVLIAPFEIILYEDGAEVSSNWKSSKYAVPVAFTTQQLKLNTPLTVGVKVTLSLCQLFSIKSVVRSVFTLLPTNVSDTDAAFRYTPPDDNPEKDSRLTCAEKVYVCPAFKVILPVLYVYPASSELADVDVNLIE